MKSVSALLLSLILLFSAGCSSTASQSQPEDALFCDDLSNQVQDVAQLHVASDTTKAQHATTTLFQYDTIYAMWFPVMDYAEMLQGKTEVQFRDAIRQAFQAAANMGINTVYLHVRAYGDAYYRSSLFPAGSYWTDTSFDPLEVMLKEAHALELSAHAWINPLRCGTVADMESLEDSVLLKQWYQDREKNGTYLVQVENRYWLNPAYPEVRQLIADGVAELVTQYDIDGVHLDDYFYPTTEEFFDAAAYQAGDFTTLSAFRLAQTSAMVQEIYNTVKATASTLPLSISPLGTMNGNYNSQYADVTLWGSKAGYCDVLIPQVYFGFENETAPFAETVALWENTVTCDSVSLVIGIGTHKFGKYDTYAGRGCTEWQTNLDLPSQQVAYLLEQPVQGIAIYDYSTTFQPDTEAAAMAEQVKKIGALLRGG